MQFRVPQFIDIEDKIIGPLGWKQLAYILAGLGLTYLIFKSSSSKIIATVLSLPVISLFGALAFIKINNKDFLGVSEDAFKYFFSSKIYTWQKSSEANKDQSNSDNNLGKSNSLNKNSGGNNSSGNNLGQDTLKVVNSGTSKLGDKAFNVDIG